jgi:Zn-dependent protease with chaperone function
MTPAGFYHRLLAFLYFPFLAFLCMSLAALLILAVVFLPAACGVPFMVIAVVFLGLPFAHAAITLARALSQRKSDRPELRPPRAMVGELYELVWEVARRHQLKPPDDIRLAADTVAHVYEAKGLRVLVLGAVALATFSREALAGIVAHELAHFTAGDTGLARSEFPAAVCVALLDYEFERRPLSKLNPIVWLICGYHLLYHLAAAAHSRAQEFAADRYEVLHVGKEVAAAALIRLTVPERLPWSRLSTVLEQHAATGLPATQLFAEQVRRARATSRSEWQDALAKELKRPTGAFDSHPALKDRLKALGVSPRKALQIVLDDSGPPAHELIPAWPKVERLLAETLIEPYRELHLIKRDVAQIFLGRPLG